MFDTKIVLVVREDLATWQKMNVVAFLTSGVAGNAGESLMGEAYRDQSGQTYYSLLIQPVIVLAATGDQLSTIHRRARERDVPTAIYIEDMFSTGHDAANRDTVTRYPTDALPLVGLGLRAEKKIADKITKGAKMHP